MFSPFLFFFPDPPPSQSEQLQLHVGKGSEQLRMAFNQDVPLPRIRVLCLLVVPCVKMEGSCHQLHVTQLSSPLGKTFVNVDRRHWAPGVPHFLWV